MLFFCRVEVLKQALKSKSRWWRKCPIQISSSGRALLSKEASFVLFAEGSAAKEQWYTALKHASSGRSKSAVEDAYAQFCVQVRESKGHISDYPQVRSGSIVQVYTYFHDMQFMLLFSVWSAFPLLTYAHECLDYPFMLSRWGITPCFSLCHLSL